MAVNNTFYVLHTGREGTKVLKNFCRSIVKVDSRISILTVAAYNFTPVFCAQLKVNHLNYYSKQEELKFEVNADKIDIYKHLLETITTDYCLLADSKDSCIIKDLDQEFINKFEAMNIPFIVCKDRYLYPRFIIPGEPYKTYGICSGLIFGKTHELLYYFTKLSEFKAKITAKYNIDSEIAKSDQFWMRLYDLERKEFTQLDQNEDLLATWRQATFDEDTSTIVSNYDNVVFKKYKTKTINEILIQKE